MIPHLSIHPREEKSFVNQTTTKLFTNVYNSYVQPSKTGHIRLTLCGEMGALGTSVSQ